MITFFEVVISLQRLTLKKDRGVAGDLPQGVYEASGLVSPGKGAGTSAQHTSLLDPTSATIQWLEGTW